MKNKYCNFSALRNESDVEQKMVYPFLCSDLGFRDVEIRSKDLVEAHYIGKGKSGKSTRRITSSRFAGVRSSWWK